MGEGVTDWAKDDEGWLSFDMQGNGSHKGGTVILVDVDDLQCLWRLKPVCDLERLPDREEDFALGKRMYYRYRLKNWRGGKMIRGERA